ncbi:MAG TPA: tRNA (adenosine(37)-N6)-dimethylallyltransferase MiaA [Micavibrio sp.]
MSKAQSITVICGPTASGKSALAVDLAEKRSGIVINADSMQVYDALPILTAQPGQDDLDRVPHRLYSRHDARHKYSAQDWRNDAVAEIESAFSAGRTPVIVGGTGLYLKALIHGLSEMPDVPDDIRAAGNALQKEMGNPAFHAMLAQRDPVMAGRLNPNDTQRLIRAWEVFETTGESLAVWQGKPLQGPPDHWLFHVIVITPNRAELRRRCDLRFDLMLRHGLLDEIGDFSARIDRNEVPETAAIANALGFRPLRQFLKGAISRDEAVFQAKAQTRQYAKRQDTWFRHQIRSNPQIESIRRVPVSE